MSGIARFINITLQNGLPTGICQNPGQALPTKDLTGEPGFFMMAAFAYKVF
jgi:hypothetical protein